MAAGILQCSCKHWDFSSDDVTICLFFFFFHFLVLWFLRSVVTPLSWDLDLVLVSTLHLVLVSLATTVLVLISVWSWSWSGPSSIPTPVLTCERYPASLEKRGGSRMRNVVFLPSSTRLNKEPINRKHLQRITARGGNKTATLELGENQNEISTVAKSQNKIVCFPAQSQTNSLSHEPASQRNVVTGCMNTKQRSDACQVHK